MLTTEAEAREKWCPQALNRIVVTPFSDGGSNLNLQANDHDGKGRPIVTALCVASDCMFWRWGQKPNPSYEPKDQSQMVLRVYDPRTAQPAFIPDEGGRGYCGAAGKPS